MLKKVHRTFFQSSFATNGGKFSASRHRFEPCTKEKYQIPKRVFGIFGGNNRARTCDPLLVRQMLSQLSYAPVSVIYYNTIN